MFRNCNYLKSSFDDTNVLLDNLVVLIVSVSFRLGPLFVLLKHNSKQQTHEQHVEGDHEDRRGNHRTYFVEPESGRIKIIIVIVLVIVVIIIMLT